MSCLNPASSSRSRRAFQLQSLNSFLILVFLCEYLKSALSLPTLLLLGGVTLFLSIRCMLSECYNEQSFIFTWLRERKKNCPQTSKSKRRHDPAELVCNLLVVAQTSMYTKVLMERDGRKRFTKCLQRRTLQYSLLAVISSL